MSDGPEWFAPRRFGLGSGLPIAWQGWAVLGVYAALLALTVALLGRHNLVSLAIILPATAILFLVCARTTRGGWRWRWGSED